MVKATPTVEQKIGLLDRWDIPTRDLFTFERMKKKMQEVLGPYAPKKLWEPWDEARVLAIRSREEQMGAYILEMPWGKVLKWVVKKAVAPFEAFLRALRIIR